MRQEALGPLKPYLARRYASYHGVADLYVYFYERGLELLAPRGTLSYIITNKWLRAGYGEPLRRLFIRCPGAVTTPAPGAWNRPRSRR
ncbi:MAG: hypothetical protein AADX96_17740 [Thiocapsa sp. C3-sup]